MSESRKKDISTTIGQRINELLAQNKTMQKELADHLGIQHNTISYYLKGERVPDYPKLVAIAEYFNVSTDYLLGRTDTKTVDKDIQMICKYTGLSEEAVKRLHNCCYSEDTKKVLSFLIAPKSKSRFFDDLLNVSVDLSDYQVKYLEIVRKLSSVEPQIHTLSEKEIEDIYELYIKRKQGHSVSVQAAAITMNQVYWYGIFNDMGL